MSDRKSFFIFALACGYILQCQSLMVAMRIPLMKMPRRRMKRKGEEGKEEGEEDTKKSFI